MKVGLGLYRQMLSDEHFRFARQLGVSHVVAHLEDYFSAKPQLSSGETAGWGRAGTSNWSYDTLRDLIASMERHDLELAAIENLPVAGWSDILLDGPQKQAQMEGLKQLVRDAGRAGVPCIGYNFSLAGVWGWSRGPFARGGAMSVGFDIDAIDPNEPIPDGMVWNMVYRDGEPGKVVAPVSRDELWQRYAWFLDELLPVAEEAGVRLAAHPDDPPMDQLRGTARLINWPGGYERAFGLNPSPANAAELCLGSVQEMGGDDVYRLTAECAASDRIGYIHFRNVRGSVPKYHEVFLDEGDIDMARIVRILAGHGFEGVLIPDHTPELVCQAPWHAGMAYAVGYMKALIAEVMANPDCWERPIETEAAA
ncbi:MAG: mannonate dehydratase [Pseudomonadota bacterium]